MSSFVLPTHFVAEIPPLTDQAPVTNTHFFVLTNEVIKTEEEGEEAEVAVPHHPVAQPGAQHAKELAPLSRKKYPRRIVKASDKKKKSPELESFQQKKVWGKFVS